VNAQKLGPIELASGYLRAHALTYLYAAFFTIGLLAFASYVQTYLLNVNLRLPEGLQGRAIAGLNFANELVALALVGPFGALADKIGRRPVYAFGFLWLAAGFLLYPEARTLPQLFGCALFFSVGVAAVGTMLGTVLADTPAEPSRGKLVGVAGVAQGLGALVIVVSLARLPKWLIENGYDAIDAGRIALWIAAGLAAVSSFIVFRGLKRGTPSESAVTEPLGTVMREGLAVASGNPRIRFAYLLQFASFGDRVVFGTFFMMRLQQEWLARGATMADALARTRWAHLAVMLAGLITALLVGVLLDRKDRLRTGVGAMGLATVAYFICAFVDDPTAWWLVLPVAALLGVGQIAALIAGQTMLGEEAPRERRGAVFGLAGICASAGILFTNGLGGWLFDQVSKGGPFLLLAAVNLVIFLYGWRMLRRGAPVTN
jgi:MFS family permease